MTTIRQADFIQSIADAFQFISFYHPADFVRALDEAYESEASPAARNAIAQLLVNSRMSAEGRRPICQDTGIVVVFLKVGMNVRWDATMACSRVVQDMPVTVAVDTGGSAVHETGPREWRMRIGKIPVTVA